MAKIFCADDWGFSPGINAGILELAKRGWLKSVSCVANAPFLSDSLDMLLRFADDGLEFALQFNLTDGNSLSGVNSLTDASGKFLSHKRLLLKAALGVLNAQEIGNEFEIQLAKLQAFNIPVTRLDGHHHVHLLPPVFRALEGLFCARGILLVRRMVDAEHQWSLAQTQLCKWNFPEQGQAWKFENSYYLLSKNLKTRDGFFGKLAKTSGAPLIVHPALYNDFAVSGMRDPLQQHRVTELLAIIEYLQ